MARPKSSLNSEPERRDQAQRRAPTQPKFTRELAQALIARMALLAKPDKQRENETLDAISDAESLAEGWERVLARGLLPTAWLDDSERRFYGPAGRCARCGRTGGVHVGCAANERVERSYAFSAFPTSWWELIVLVGHHTRFAEAETLAREYEAKIKVGSPNGESTTDAQRRAWTWVTEDSHTLYGGFDGALPMRVKLAVELAEQTVGLPLPKAVRQWVKPLYQAMKIGSKAPELKSPIQFLGETEVSYGGQQFGWSELRCALLPSPEAARALPRGVALGP